MPERDVTVERRLGQLAAEVDTLTPDLASAVLVRLDGTSAPPTRHRHRRIAAFATAILLLTAGTAYAASQEVRDAVRDLLGIGAVEIERVSDLDEPAAGLELGERIDSGEAAPRALSEPIATFVADLAGQRAVTFVYSPSEDLPPLPAHPFVGMILTKIDGRDPAIVKQVLLSAEPVRVSGSRGYWVGGTDHLVEFPAGTPPRTSANALIWTRGAFTLRLEAEITKAEALRLARTIR